MDCYGIQALPQEVFHIILDYLGNNKTILRSCSLVCRTWMQASRPRLFAIVSLYACERRLIDFLDFLDAHPDIAGHVRSLMLHKPMDEQSATVDGTSDASVTPFTLARTARRLPRLRECQLYFVHIVPSTSSSTSESESIPEASDVAAPSATPVELSVFHIFGSSHQEISPFLELLAHFRIDRLELELVTFVQECTPPVSELSERIEVRDLWADLETADDSPIAILSSLAPALSPANLQAFHCSWREWSGCGAVGSFLHHVGRSIADLALNMSVVSWVEDRGSAIQREDWGVLNLASCPNVRTFRTSMPLPMACTLPDIAEVKQCIASYRTLLSCLPSAVDTVVIYMSTISRPLPAGGAGGGRIRGAGHREGVSQGLNQNQVPVDFQDIEDVLLDLPNLRKVVIAMRAAQSVRQGAAAVSKAFPALHARGIMEVRSGSVLRGSSSW